MAGASNGKLADPGQKGMNGHTVGGPRTKAAKKKSGFNLLSIITRILTWYSIITIAFRCPQTVDLLTDTSPKICKPYFQVKSVLSPHLTPYYDAYAAPYVDAARPYYNTLDQRVIAPATVLGTKYAAPRIAQAQAFSQAQWQKTVQPEVQKYQAILKQKYDETLAPHVDKAISATSPYIDVAKTNALQTYYGHILPTYTTVQPYAQQGYGIASDFAVNTGIPYAQWAWTTGSIFLDRTVLPKLRILYGENVEPQLVRIGERLGRYRDGKKVKAAVESIDISSSASSTSSSLSSVASSVASAHATPAPSAAASSSTPDVYPPTPEPDSAALTEEEIIAKAQKVVQADLKNWQKKWAKAADEGSEELDARITEITNRLVENQAQKVGEAHLTQLEETIKSSLKSLKSDIISIVSKATSPDSEESEEEISTAVRKAGVAIKDKAQSVRTWRLKYDDETNYLVSKALSDTLEIIDTIRDMGLQEIGMRWAWTDGITHKDWTKYHSLKTRFDEWREEIQTVATEHPGLDKARAASEEVESRAMGEAEDAAKELASIKETARWKLSTGDTSDDFTPKIIPAKIAKAINDVSEAVVGTSTSSQGTVDSVVSVASVSASSIADQASSSIIGTPQGSVESVVSAASASASSIADQASSSIIGTQQGTMESVSSIVSESISSVIDEASTSIVGTSTGTVESLASAASDAAPIQSASSLSDAAGSSISSASSVASDTASSISSSVISAGSSASSQASKSVWGGAMAQQVEARKIVYEDIIDDSDDDTYSEKIQSMASAAGDKFADVTKAVSEALLKPTSTQGSVESVTSLAAKQYSSALAAASSVLYGTEKGTGESVASVASGRYADAVAAASAAIYGTPLSPMQSISSAVSSAYYGPPTGVLESISSVAASRLSEGLSLASAQFSSARSSIGPAQTPLAQKYLLQAENQYYAGIGMAHARYSEFLDAASSAVMPTQTPFHQSVLSRASESIIGTTQGNVEYATSAALEQFSKATAAASSNLDGLLSSLSSLAATSTAAPTESLASAASSQYSAALSQASSFYSIASEKAQSVASQASSSVIGSETPWTESVASQASQNWEALVTKASEQIYGKPTPYFITKGYSVPGSLYSDATEGAGSLYAQATEQAISQYEAMQSLVSELVSGKEAPFTESVYSRFSSAYATGAFAAVSSASSYASDTYASATSVVGDTYSSANSIVGENYSSASSAISAAFSPPPALESILDSASSRVNDAVEAASIQFYGTQKGTYEQAASSAASVYSSAQSLASEKLYGSSAGYVEAASSSIADAAASAQAAISEAIYGTPTGTVESVTNVVGETYASATSVIAENISAAQASASSLIYGPEKGAIESAQSRLTSAVESARVKLAEFAAAAGDGASDAVKKVSEGVEDFASSVSSAVDAATSQVNPSMKDEL